jgi:hypothetical protein
MGRPDDHAERGDRRDPVRGGGTGDDGARSEDPQRNAAPDLLAAYPDNTTARLEAGNAPGAKKRNLTKMTDSKRNPSAHSVKSALRACGTDR